MINLHPNVLDTISLVNKVLEDLPTGKTSKLKIGENDYALKALAQDNPGITLEDIKLHNAMASGYDQGFSDAIDKIKEWKESVLKKSISIFD